MESALRFAVRNGLGELHRAICGDPLNKDHEVTPLFKLNLVLLETASTAAATPSSGSGAAGASSAAAPAAGSVEYRPSLLELTHRVNDVARALIGIVGVMPRCEDVLPASIHGYNATDARIAAITAKLNTSAFGNSAASKELAAAVDDAAEGQQNLGGGGAASTTGGGGVGLPSLNIGGGPTSVSLTLPSAHLAGSSTSVGSISETSHSSTSECIASVVLPNNCCVVTAGGS